MKRNTLKTVVLAFGIMIISNMSFGQPSGKQDRKAPPTFSELLKEMDNNEDGKLSKDELEGPLKEDFSKVDADEDGFITEEEFKKAPKPRGRERKEKR